MNQDYKDILSAFNEEGVKYLIVGAYALAVHGVPRATGDMDIWVRMSPENAERAWRALANFGAPLAEFKETDLNTTGIVLQIGVAPCRIDVLTSIDAVDFDQAWPARVETEVEGLKIPVIGRAHLIANKQAVGRPQDLADVARLNDEKP